MVRTLILLRHAKAAWPAECPDHKRPLAPRGVRDAPETGKWLVAAGRVPELVLCSTAQRTRETCDLVAAACADAAGETAPPVRFTDAIYEASAGELLDVVRSAPEGVRTLMLVGHNPGIQRLALVLADEASPADLVSRIHAGYPTNTAAVLQVSVPWSRLDPGGATVVDLASRRG
jgi:phosphohistidine phosphatase